jgi:hypothetical protein
VSRRRGVEAARAAAIGSAARSALQDAATAELVSALESRGISSILLKGPSIDRLLYGGNGRSYVDSDVLVAPDGIEPARAELRKLGFSAYTPPYGEAPELEHGEAWVRGDSQVMVDLHWTLAGVGVAPAELWRVLEGRTERMVVATAEVAVLRPEGIAFHVALHAGHHGRANPRSIGDLDQALSVLDARTWREASNLAARLGATEMFAAGLRLLPPGRSLAADLGLPDNRSVQTVLLTRSQTTLTLGIERLARTPGVRRRLGVVGRELLPPPAVMREWWPPAARGRVWLLAGYLWRWAWLLVHAGPAVIAWRRAVRESRRPSRADRDDR